MSPLKDRKFQFSGPYPEWSSMTLWIDGDSCYRKIREWLAEVANNNHWDLRILSDDSHKGDSKLTHFWLTIPKGQDSVDRYILEHASPGDLLVTRDLIFASEALTKGLLVLNDRGLKFTGEYLKIRLEERDFSLAIKAGGSGSAKVNRGFRDEYLEAFKKQIIYLLEE